MFSPEQFSLSSTEKKIVITFILIAMLFPTWMYANSNSRLDLTKSLVNDQSLDISNYSNNTIDKVKYENQIYTDKAPGSSFFAVPVYTGFKLIEGSLPSVFDSNSAYINYDKVSSLVEKRPEAFLLVDAPLDNVLLRFLIIFTLSTVPAAATLLLIYRTLLRNDLSTEISTVTTLIIGFGTIVLHYSTVFMANTLAMFLGFLSFYILEVEETSSNRRIAAAGVTAGLASLVEYYMLITPFFLATYLLIHRIDGLRNWRDLTKQQNFRSPVIYLSGALAGFSPFFVYNYFTVGNPIIPVKVYGEWIPRFSIEIVNTHPAGGIFVSPFILTLGTPEMIARVLFGIGRGLFIYSPILFLAMPGLYYLYREQKRKAGLILSIFSAFVVFNATYITWYGGSAFGSRYLLAVIPFLSIPLGYTLDRFWNRKHFKKMLTVLAAASIFVSVLGFTQIGLHPTEELGGEENYGNEFSSAYADITGIEAYLNPLPKYTQQLLENGPRSPWIEMAGGAPDKNLNYFSSPDPQIAEATINNNMIILEDRNLELIIMTIIFLGLWRKEISRQLPLTQKQGLVILAISAAILLLSAVSIEDNFKGNGWYSTDENPLISDKAQYKIKSDRGLLTFELSPYRDRNLTVRNGEKSYRFKLRGKENISVPVEKEVNSLNLEFDSCQRPVKHSDSTDVKCISAEVHKIEFTSIENLALGDIPYKKQVLRELPLENIPAGNLTLGDIPYRKEVLERLPTKELRGWNQSLEKKTRYKKGWYPSEKLGKDEWRWMKERGSLYLLSSKSQVVNASFKIRPFLGRKESRTLKVDVEGRDKINRELNREGEVSLLLYLSTGLNKIQFNSNQGCSIPSNISDSTDNRCLSFQVSNMTFENSENLEKLDNGFLKFNEGWYSEEDAGDGLKRRWMSDNSEIKVFSREEISLTFFSYHHARNLTVTLNDKRKSYRIKPEGTEITLNPDERIESLGLESRCSIPSEVGNSTDKRCLSVGITYPEK